MTVPPSPLVVCTVKFKEDRQLHTRTQIRSLRDWIPYAQGMACLYTHQPTGVRVRARKRTVETIEACLPRVLHGSNGMLIKDDTELAAALATVDAIVSQIAGPARSPREFTRLDFAWQFRGDVRLYIAAFRHARHPFVRKETHVYSDSSLCFPGRRCRITFYDKLREQTGKSGNVVRVEVSLRREKVRDLLGKGHSVASFRFRDAYRAFRKVLRKFHPRKIPKISTLAEVCAVAERESVPVLDYLRLTKSARTVRRLHQQVTQAAVSHYRLNWRKRLPKFAPPAPVEI